MSEVHPRARLSFAGYVALLLPTAGVGGAALMLVALWPPVSARAAGPHAADVPGAALRGRPRSIAVAGTLLALRGTGSIALCALPAPVACDRAARLLGEVLGDAIGILRAGDPRLLGAIASWAFDAAVLGAMLEAFGATPSP